MDEVGQKVQEYESALGLATALEKYDQAAELKKEVDLLNANDVVEQVLEVSCFTCLSQVQSTIYGMHYFVQWAPRLLNLHRRHHSMANFSSSACKAHCTCHLCCTASTALTVCKW